MMTNISNLLTQQYIPVKSIVLYEGKENSDQHYAEAFDFDTTGKMVNAHPLSRQEMTAMGKTLLAVDITESRQLHPKAILDNKVLYLDSGENGFAIWHTPAQTRRLLFTDNTGLKNGTYPVPTLLWKAGTQSLEIFALKQNNRPTMQTALYEAPYFNIYSDGKVCMGTVNIDLDHEENLDSLMNKWELYFFNSRFSHMIVDRSPAKANIVQLYKTLYGSKKPFPLTSLKKHTKTIKQLING